MVKMRKVVVKTTTFRMGSNSGDWLPVTLLCKHVGILCWRYKNGNFPSQDVSNLRAINLYMLMSPGNTVHPPQFVPNFVTGILFMNKAHHTTFFGQNIEFIHGIHMVPLTPISP